MVVGFEQPQALIAIVDIENRDLPEQHAAGNDKTRKGRPSQSGKRKGNRHQRQHAAIEKHKPGSRVVAKKTRSRTNADEGVILLVLMGIDRVIANGPDDRGEIDQNCGAGKRAEHRGPSDQRAQENASPRKNCGQSVNRLAKG